MTHQHQDECAPNSLTEEQIQFFHDNGYLILDHYKQVDEMNQLRDRMAQIIDEQFDINKHHSIFSCEHDDSHTKDIYFLDSSDKISFFLEQNKDKAMGSVTHNRFIMNKVGHALADKDEFFKKFTFTSAVQNMSKQLMNYEKVTVVQSMYIFKPPIIGGEVTPHRDSTFILTHEKPCLGWWIPLEDATTLNGCLWGVPGSHKWGLASKWVRSSKNNQENQMKFIDLISSEEKEKYEERDREAQYVPLEMKAGSVVLLHGHFLHKSYKNESNKSREAYTFHLADEEDYDREQNWLLRDQFPHFWPS